MRFSRFVPLLVVACVLAFVPSSTNAATNGRRTETQHDTTSDIMRWVDGRLGIYGGFKKVPGRVESDIEWIRTTRGSFATRVRVHFRELRRTGDVKQFFFAVQGSSGNVVAGSAYIDNANPDVPPNWSGVLSDSVHPKVTFRIDYDTNDFFLTVPNTLLSNSEWVRSSFQMATIINDGYDVYYLDDARAAYRTQGPRPRSFGTYGPKVFR